MGARWRRLIAGFLAALALVCGTLVSTAMLPERFASSLTGYYRSGEWWVEWIGPLKDRSVTLFCDKLNALRGGPLAGASACYWTLVPDKGVYTPEQTTDYAAFYNALEQGLDKMTGIDLSGTLTLADYYRTDRHWRQEQLEPVVSLLGERMGFSSTAVYSTQQGPDFIGAYRPYLPGWTRSEPFGWLTGEAIDAAVVENMQRPDQTGIYWDQALGSSNQYDLFLGGASPLITIRSPKAATDRKLVIFGDSFVSSLAPLLCDVYAEITLVDLRYLGTSVLEEYLDAEGKEVLFAYSAWVVNNSAMLR